MEIPKFLLADNAQFPDDLFVIHTEYPRFVINLVDDEVEWLDDLEQDSEQEEVINIVKELIGKSHEFYEKQVAFYEEE